MYDVCRYLHARILSLRPILSSLTASDAHGEAASGFMGSLLSRPIAIQCSVICVKVAQEAINVVHQRRIKNTHAMEDLASWWYNVLFLYTAATVLIAARLNRTIFPDQMEDSILDSWIKVIDLLDGYSVFGASIKRLVITLRLLFDTVPGQYSRYRQSQQGGQIDLDIGPNISSQANPSGQRESFTTSAPLSPRFPGAHFDFRQDELPSQGMSGFDGLFNPSDISWLTAAPFEF